MYITDARPEDRGLYLCEVENSAGQSYASVAVEVESKFKIVYFKIFNKVFCSCINEHILKIHLIKNSRLRGIIGSRPSDHYFRSVCLSVCLFVCLCRVFLSRL